MEKMSAEAEGVSTRPNEAWDSISAVWRRIRAVLFLIIVAIFFCSDSSKVTYYVRVINFILLTALFYHVTLFDRPPVRRSRPGEQTE